MTSNAVPSVRAQYTHRRTYLRPLDEDGKVFETVNQAMDRVLGHQVWLWEKQLGRPLRQREWDEITELAALMERQLVSMSGRVKWMGGTDLVKERAAGAFNCSFSVAYTPADLVDIFWLLLNGCGVGFKPVEGLLSGFPSSIKTVEVIPSERTERGGAEASEEIIDIENGVWTIKFGDSAKGWAKAIGMLFGEKPRVHTLRLDFSELRPGGKRLRGYGWISSGWRPLAEAMRKIAVILQRAAHRPLNKGEVIDVVNHLGTVLSSRRSAQLCLIETDATTLDELFNELHWYIEFKTNRWEKGEGQREQSNNSIGFRKKPSRAVIVELLRRILPTGEPGFVNVEQARVRAPEMEGLNPCAEILLPNKGFCVSGDTPLVTRQGLVQIADAVGRPVEIWNGEEWSQVEPYLTGDEVTLFRVRAGDGSYLDVSANHRWQVFHKNTSEAWRSEQEVMVTTLELMKLLATPNRVVRLPDFTVDLDTGETLKEGIGYTLGVAVGDGCLSTTPGKVVVDLFGEKRHLPVVGRPEAQDRYNGNHQPFRRVILSADPEMVSDLRESFAPLFKLSRADRLSFLAGLLDTDGSRVSSGGVRIYVSGEQRGRELQMLLRTVDLRGSLNFCQPAGALTNLGVRKHDLWYVQICDARSIPADRVDVSDGHPPTAKGRFQLVRSIERLPETGPSYCLTEPKRGMCVFGNMLTYQCNLVQTVWHRFNGDLAGLLRAQWIAARANYRQTCVSMRDGVLQLQWNDAQKLLRLCGVSPTGAVAWEGIKDPKMLEAARDAAIAGADSMADEFGTPRARRVTQVQPAGTSSKALGLEGDEVHEGAHLALSRWIFNWINFPSNDPMLEAFGAAGYDMKPNPNDPTGMLVCWPVEYPASPMFTPVRGALREGVEREWLLQEQQYIYAENGNPVHEADAYEHLEVNQESAISQLERYRLLMKHYVQHNCSITVSFDDSEIDDMADWFMTNWDDYVGVSFLKRNNPLATAEDLGFKYLPQECVSRERYEEYVKRLTPIDISQDKSAELLDQGECATGGCPIR